MLCDKCKQIEANKNNKFFDNRLQQELYFCDYCFKTAKPQSKLNVNQFFNSQEEEIFCSFCNTSSTDFLDTGYLGCENCYKSFEEIIMPIINNIHKKTSHTGKFVSSNLASEDVNVKLQKLTRQLHELVEQEEYEKASKVKFEINKLKENLL